MPEKPKLWTRLIPASVPGRPFILIVSALMLAVAVVSVLDDPAGAVIALVFVAVVVLIFAVLGLVERRRAADDPGPDASR